MRRDTLNLGRTPGRDELLLIRIQPLVRVCSFKPERLGRRPPKF
jgi:hypothetical protein